MSDNRFNYVVILDSIPEGELNIARKLFEDLDMCASAYSHTPRIAYQRIENEYHLFDYLEHLRSQNEQNHAFPLLHIESHGYEDGLQLAGGSLVSWENLKKGLIPLNVSMRLNLMIVLASCFGGALAKAITLSDRAPVWGLIGPTEKISTGELERDFGAFYRKLFSTGSPKAAIDELNKVSSQDSYYRTSAERFFYRGWQNYKEKWCTPGKLKMRARRMRKKAKKQNIDPLPTAYEFKKRFVRKEPDAFEKFRDRYFMCDLYPENQNRFLVTYEKAEAYKSR